MNRAAEQAFGVVRERGGVELSERLLHLERLRESRLQPPSAAPPPPRDDDSVDVDVVIAGGGLWSLLAPLLRARGVSVMVADRARAAQSHREWNASGAELARLVSLGLMTEAELRELVVARYDYGTCRFAGGGDYPIRGVLDEAVDAKGLLEHGRRLGEARAVRYLDGRIVGSHSVGGARVRVRTTSGGVSEDLVAKVLVDARGAASPYATADLVCPTVGGVVSGLREGLGPCEMNPRVGDILATIDGIDEGRQHIWEAFPGRTGETTVYLFYYAKASEPLSLLELYARFFRTLPSYKRGDAALLRPTFGLIPGWSRLSPAPRPPPGNVVLVGDAAARHSPLTYCGFGATLRSLGLATERIAGMVSGERPSGAAVVDDASVHSLSGALAHMMASRSMAGGELNGLLDAAFRTLFEMGEGHYAALLRDEMAPADFIAFLRRTATRHPAVWRQVIRGLGPVTAGRWGLGAVRAMWTASA